jgi:predicted dehydrogenase
LSTVFLFVPFDVFRGKPLAMQTLRFGIIGGAAGITPQHVSAIRQTPNCELVALTDVAQDRCRDYAQKEKLRFHPTLKDLLADRDINTVAICTPHPFHCELALAALKAGKHVLTEKPMCVTVSEADRLVRAAARAKTKFAVVHQWRFRPDILKARELLTNGSVGALYRTAMVFAWFRTDAYYASVSWRATWRGEGGGVLMNQAPHALDVFAWLGGLPKKVYAWTPTVAHKIEVEDCASALLEYENGAQGFIHASTIQVPNQERFEFCGDNGRIVIENGVRYDKVTPSLTDYCRNSPELWGQPKFETENFPPAPAVPLMDSHVAVYREFARAVLAGEQPPVSAADARNSIELVNALILSHHKKKPVTLPINRKEYDALLAKLIRQGAS